MAKNYRQCNPLMTKMHDAIWSAYDKGYSQAKTDFQRIQGEWTQEALGVKGVWYRCSNCKKYAIADYLFCPQCGSDMRGGERKMIIPRHKICDICGEEVGINKRYFIIKSKNIIVASAGSCSDNQKHHICEDCMQEFEEYLHSKLRGKEA